MVYGLGACPVLDTGVKPDNDRLKGNKSKLVISHRNDLVQE
jgi:hypothetical protein